jgi:type II secretion system protein N
MSRLIKGFAVFIISIPAAAVLLWMFAVPQSLITGLMEEKAQKAGMSLETEGFRKGILFGIGFDSASLIKDGKDVFSLTDVSARINPLYLLLLKLGVSFEGSAGGGGLKGSASFKSNDYSAFVKIENVRLEETGALKDFGRGLLNAEFSLKNGEGAFRFSVTEAEFALKGLDASVPLGLFKKSQGVLTFKDSTLEATSVSLEGNGIYARLKGRIKGKDADLSLEMMPDASFMPDAAMSLILGRYRVSPGYYVIPIRTEIKI